MSRLSYLQRKRFTEYEFWRPSIVQRSTTNPTITNESHTQCMESRVPGLVAIVLGFDAKELCCDLGIVVFRSLGHQIGQLRQHELEGPVVRPRIVGFRLVLLVLFVGCVDDWNRVVEVRRHLGFVLACIHGSVFGLLPRPVVRHTRVASQA